METLYEHAGGDGALHRLEELFYVKVLNDPVLHIVFRREPHHVEHLTWFTAESFGGPDRFSRELGFQHIIDVHRHLKITDEQRARFVALYLEALDEVGLPGDEAFREAVRSHLEVALVWPSRTRRPKLMTSCTRCARCRGSSGRPALNNNDQRRHSALRRSTPVRWRWGWVELELLDDTDAVAEGHQNDLHARIPGNGVVE